MRTAEEMTLFCKDNNTGSGMTQKWTLKHFTVAENQLNDDEKVLFAFVGLYNYVSATNHDSNFAIAVTNDRIIAGQKKLMGENVKTITRRNLNDISKTTGMIWGILTIDTIKEKLNIATNKSEIDAIYNGVNKILFQDEIIISKTTTNTTTKSPIEELKEYKELLDLDIITQEEFDKKKQEVLG